MDKGGAPEGNNNAGKGRMFFAELRKIAVQNPHKLRKVAEKLFDEAEAGEPWAVKEIIDRFDGKAVQSTEISGADGKELTGFQLVFVEPNE